MPHPLLPSSLSFLSLKDITRKSYYAGCFTLRAVFQTGAIFLADHLKSESLTDESVTPVLSRIRMPASKEWSSRGCCGNLGETW